MCAAAYMSTCVSHSIWGRSQFRAGMNGGGSTGSTTSATNSSVNLPLSLHRITRPSQICVRLRYRRTEICMEKYKVALHAPGMRHAGTLTNESSGERDHCRRPITSSGRPQRWRLEWLTRGPYLLDNHWLLIGCAWLCSPMRRESVNCSSALYMLRDMHLTAENYKKKIQKGSKYLVGDHSYPQTDVVDL